MLPLRSVGVPSAAGLTLVAHADWSAHPRKRWITVARPSDGHGWTMAAPCPVGAPGSLLARLRAASGGGAVVLGVDLPLGLPRAFVAAHGLDAAWGSFPAFLRGLRAVDPWFTVCTRLDEIGPARPFYPARGQAGMTRISHARALGLQDGAALSRLCDRATTERPAGAPPFWTLGANQTGKAALAGWRDLLLPSFDPSTASTPPRLWPFEGDLDAVIAPGAVVLAETYPAEASRHVGVKLVGSKQRLADRAAAGASLRAALQGLGVRPEPALLQAVQDGFGPRHGCDDGFDSVLGALCVLGVVTGRRPGRVPEMLTSDAWVRRWEGWVLGQTAVPRAVSPDIGPPASCP